MASENPTSSLDPVRRILDRLCDQAAALPQTSRCEFEADLQNLCAAIDQDAGLSRALFASLDGGFLLAEVIYDPNGRPVDLLYHRTNPAAVRILGADYTGRRMTEIDPNFEAFWPGVFAHVARAGVSERMERYSNALRAWFSYYLFPIAGPASSPAPSSPARSSGAARSTGADSSTGAAALEDNGEGPLRPNVRGKSSLVACIFQDITETRRREKNIALLAEIGSDLSRIITPNEILRVVGEKMKAYFAAPFLTFGEADEDDEGIWGVYYYAGPDAPRLNLPDYITQSLLSEMQAGRAIVVEDVQSDPRFAGRADAYLKWGVRSQALVPFTEKGRLRFTIIVQRSEPYRWRADEIALLEELAQRIYPRLEQARAQEALRKSQEELSAELDGAIHLQKISTQLMPEGRADVLYNQLLEAAIALARSDAGSMQIFSPEKNSLHLVSWKGLAPESAAFWEWVDASSTSTCGMALKSGSRVVLPDVEEDALISAAGNLNAYRASGIRAVQSVPLRTRGGQTVGMISTHWRAPHQSTEREQRLLDVLARQAADLIERAQVEQALADSERRYRELIQYAPTAIYEVDFRSRRFTSVNDAMVDLSGYSREELLLMDPLEMMDEEGQHLFRQRIARWLSGEPPEETVEYRIRAKEGHTIYAVLQASFTRDAEGHPLGAMVVGHDVTQRKLAEMELRKSEATLRASEQRFRSSIESLNEAFMIFSAVREGGTPGGKIIDFRWEYVNSAACSLYHSSQEQINGHTILELFPEQAKMGIIARYAEVVETGRPMNEKIEYNNEGSPSPRIQGVFGLRAGKYGDGLIVTANDITERTRLEAEHQRAIQQQEIHHRLAEQREMERQSIARDIHDGPIQTLSSLAFSLQYLKEGYPDPALNLELNQIALGIKDAVQELRQVMNELRPPSVIRFGLAKAIRIHAEGLEEHYPQITWRIKLAEDGQILPEQTCLAMFRVYQEAVNNIVRHAKATRAWIHYRVLTDQVILEIRDNGVGFVQNQDIADLTSRQHFGLAGMSERVEAIGGRLKIDSRPGQGTIIHVSVPIER